jgi:predicted nucleotidyltransferase component of viral defense system
MIPHRNISLLSNRLAKAGGRRFREDVLERDYCLAWFLTLLAESDLKPVLAFKGGTALKRCYFSDYRFSEDLDFTLIQAIPVEELLSRLEAVYTPTHERSGITFAFDRADRQTHANSHAFYLKYIGPLPRGNDVKVDVTIREQLVHPLRQLPVLRGYDEFTDLPAGPSLEVYSLEEIAAEKTIALADRARNEPRDLFDLWHLTSNAGIDLASQADAIRKKLAFRKSPLEGIAVAIQKKEARLKALWSTRLDNQMSRLPKFDDVFRALRRTLRQAALP